MHTIMQLDIIIIKDYLKIRIFIRDITIMNSLLVDNLWNLNCVLEDHIYMKEEILIVIFARNKEFVKEGIDPYILKKGYYLLIYLY